MIFWSSSQWSGTFLLNEPVFDTMSQGISGRFIFFLDKNIFASFFFLGLITLFCFEPFLKSQRHMNKDRELLQEKRLVEQVAEGAAA
jgi:hypothetical protein